MNIPSKILTVLCLFSFLTLLSTPQKAHADAGVTLGIIGTALGGTALAAHGLNWLRNRNTNHYGYGAGYGGYGGGYNGYSSHHAPGAYYNQPMYNQPVVYQQAATYYPQQTGGYYQQQYVTGGCYQQTVQTCCQVAQPCCSYCY